MTRLEMATILLAGMMAAGNHQIQKDQKEFLCSLAVEYADELRKADAREGSSKYGK